MQPKQYYIKVTNQEINAFGEAISQQNSNEEAFIETCRLQYASQQMSLNEEDIYSLFLIKSVLTSNYTIATHILSRRYCDNILVNIDLEGNSPICTALLYKDVKMLEILKSYIDKVSYLEKTELTPTQIGTVSDRLALCMSSKTYIDEYIKPIYTAPCVNKLIEAIGEDSINDPTL